MKQPVTGRPIPLLSKIIMGLLSGMVLVWIAGCAKADGVPRNMEADYGRSVTTNRLEMMVTPPNAVDPNPPVGMGPQAAANAQGRYEQSFSEKKKTSTTLVIGSQGGGGQ